MTYSLDSSRRSSLACASIYCLLIAVAFTWCNQSATADDESKAQATVWHEARVPENWKNGPRINGKGATPDDLFFRCWVAIPEEWANRDLTLFVESVDDAREFYWQRQSVGALGDFPPEFRSGLGETKRFAIPAKFVQAGKLNELLIRVRRSSPRENFNVAAPVLFAGDQAISLRGSWQWRPGDDVTKVAAVKAKDAPATAIFRDLEGAEKLAAHLKALNAGDRPLSPAESLARMITPDDLTVELALNDPDIGQPLSMKFDARGRLWLVEYLQYPNPAGLKSISRDKYLRTVYDKVPPAPPNHFKGRDRVTIHEDTTGDGYFDSHKTFVDELSTASSAAIADDGVWVMNPPYLLFYPDRNHDDKPDGDPEVHLEGFGIEDSHSVANSLRFGPDGWLYAAQGSTVTGRIKAPDSEEPPTTSMGQLIWRYHPRDKKYEIFAEGGGNTFGVEIDSKGRIFSGHNGGDTRGFHYVQGGYSRKGFGKHGELSNPFAFGYFNAMGHARVPRFTHTFVIYEEHSLPKKYHGKMFAVAPLQGHVVLSDVIPQGSTFRTEDIGFALESRDSWFRPVDIQTGPDGSIYVVDFYEQKIDHASHYQGRVHKESGRIYRIRGKERPASLPKMADLTTDQLIAELSSGGRWRRQLAVQLLAARSDATIPAKLTDQLHRDEPSALDALWALYQRGELNAERTATAMGHSNPHVRSWAIRLICDDGKVAPEELKTLLALAKTEPNVEVQSQLACSARRLSASASAEIVSRMLVRDELKADLHIPLLLWWACERLIGSDPERAMQIFESPEVRSEPLVSEFILPRVMRRFASGGQADLQRCGKLFAQTSSDAQRKLLMGSFEEAMRLRGSVVLPASLEAELAKIGGGSLAMQVRRGDADALKSAVAKVYASNTPLQKQLELTTAMGRSKSKLAQSALLEIALKTKAPAVRVGALSSLQNFQDAEVGEKVLPHVSDWKDESRDAAISLLVSRPLWAKLLTKQVEAKKLPADWISPLMVERMRLSGDAKLKATVDQLWPADASLDLAAIQSKVDKWKGVVAAAAGNPYRGKVAYKNLCGKCHRLFGDGAEIGPDLTSYQRSDLNRILMNVAAPSLEIREGYETQLVLTEDGRTVSGFVADQSPDVVVIRSGDGSTHAIPRDEIEAMRATSKSIMPDGAFDALSDGEIRDLIAYLRSAQPLP